ncbi:54S ribosomal protein img2, mitochondrial [Erysiphe neolycopersici]|uniref:Large ribosomal subunit protein mL49 n=1 Tax=Erysiphe neolycopersici TaxID=212602 RepID=A0A420HJ82_9PEZI|nr:54S ribosomal protein img2, mitochondrial [Erysiphe neolycopersici]
MVFISNQLARSIITSLRCTYRVNSFQTKNLSTTTTPLNKVIESAIQSTASHSPLSYKVCRTPSNQLPIYHLVKNGGNKKITRIRKVQGNIQALRNDLRKALKLDDKECTINSTTGHVLVKGHKKQEIAKFLIDQKF